MAESCWHTPVTKFLHDGRAFWRSLHRGSLRLFILTSRDGYVKEDATCYGWSFCFVFAVTTAWSIKQLQTGKTRSGRKWKYKFYRRSCMGPSCHTSTDDFLLANLEHGCCPHQSTERWDDTQRKSSDDKRVWVCWREHLPSFFQSTALCTYWYARAFATFQYVYIIIMDMSAHVVHVRTKPIWHEGHMRKYCPRWALTNTVTSGGRIFTACMYKKMTTFMCQHQKQSTPRGETKRKSLKSSSSPLPATSEWTWSCYFCGWKISPKGSRH